MEKPNRIEPFVQLDHFYEKVISYIPIYIPFEIKIDEEKLREIIKKYLSQTKTYPPTEWWNWDPTECNIISR